jgi:hypothetical protein
VAADGGVVEMTRRLHTLAPHIKEGKTPIVALEKVGDLDSGVGWPGARRRDIWRVIEAGDNKNRHREPIHGLEVVVGIRVVRVDGEVEAGVRVRVAVRAGRDMRVLDLARLVGDKTGMYRMNQGLGR